MPDERPSPSTGATGRYALYWAPPADSALARIGGAWLGREGATGFEGPRPPVPGFDVARLDALTAEPRRYGLHATLKPPFALAEGSDLAMLRRTLREFAASRAAVTLPSLHVALLGRFIALTPSAPSPALEALAADCVVRFDRFRAPPTPAELARRKAAGLDPIEEAHLERWGYPYVLDRFRFHVTLTSPLEPGEAERLMAPLVRLFEPVTRVPVAIADIALFQEPAPGARFGLVERFALQAR
jgi:putative phosphonate metabolism protein